MTNINSNWVKQNYNSSAIQELTCSKGGNIFIKLVAYSLSSMVYNVRLSVPGTTNNFLLTITLE